MTTTSKGDNPIWPDALAGRWSDCDHSWSHEDRRQNGAAVRFKCWETQNRTQNKRVGTLCAPSKCSEETLN